MSDDPELPDFETALEIEDPRERLRTVLTALYGWYRETAPMQQRVFGERTAVPELDAWMARSSDPLQAAIAERLSAGLEGTRRRALVALALDFWTWQRLDREGFDDPSAAELMTQAAAG